MSTVPRANRKAHDHDIKRLNGLGLSLTTIGTMLDIHPSTVKVRLDAMGIPTADTRRGFMEDVYNSLNPTARDWISDQVEQSGVTIKDLLTHLIIGASAQAQSPKEA